jgi:beta-phosphoglucomutase
MSKTNKIQAILFDMDGVLIEAKDWHYEALNKALGLFGISISCFDHLHTYDGLPTKVKLEMLSIEQDLPVGLHGFINKLKQKFTVTEIMTKCNPLFEHEYALSRLKRKGYKMAVCSNSIGETINLMMKQSALDKYFEFYMSNESVAKSKPDPEIYIKTMERMGLNPKEVIILEDNIKGIQAARASGAHVLEIDKVTDVTFDAISAFINKVEHEQ